jgi:hypothetical protein
MVKRKAIFAAILSAIFPGLGLFYIGKIRYGAGSALVFSLLIFAYYQISKAPFTSGTHNIRVLFLLVCFMAPIFVWVAIIYFSYVSASRE